MDKIRELMDAVQNSPKAKELLRSLPAPKNDAEAAEVYAGIARELGFGLTADEILSGLKGMEQARKAQSDKVALDDGDLDSVAGGANPGCDDTHSPGEWCWFTDSCDFIITRYEEKKDQVDDQSCFGLRDATFHDDDDVDTIFKEDNNGF